MRAPTILAPRRWCLLFATSLGSRETPRSTPHARRLYSHLFKDSMPKANLTDHLVRSLRPRPTQFDVFDHKVRGLSLRTSPGGRKTFTVVYRFKGRSQRLTLGAYPCLTVSNARKKATQTLACVAMGTNPRPAATPAKIDVATIDELSSQFIEKHAKRNTKTWPETERILNRQVLPVLKGRRAIDIDKRQIHDLLDAIIEAHGPSAANHAFATLRCLFNWCVQRGLLESSPCRGISPPCKERPRQRVLSDDELG